MPKKIKGIFCSKIKARKSAFDPRSFRWIQRGRTWLLIGCPKGQWASRKKRCKVGTRAYEILEPVARGESCPRGSSGS